MIAKIKHRIAFKQARTVLLISLLLGLISTSGQIYLDLDQEKRNLEHSIDRVVALHKDIASMAVYNLNKRQAEDVTKLLVSYPEIYSARLQDDFGDILAEHSRPLAEETWLADLGGYFFRVETHIRTELNVDAAQHADASLIIDLDAAYLAHNFAYRAMTSLLLAIAYNIVLASIFLLLFYRYLSQPIVNIVHWVNRLRKGEDNQALPYQEADEIGDLVAGFASLWEERKQVTDQLNETIQDLSKSEYFARSLMDNAGDSMFLCLPDTRVVQVNNRAASSLNTTKTKLTERMLADFSLNFSTAQLEKMFATIAEQHTSTFEDVYRSDDGQEFPIEARAIRLRLQETDYILILARDISVRKEAEQQIFELAFFDPLTGLPNRRLFIDRLTSSLQLHNANDCYGAVLYLDLDRFKTINDSLGHGVGDILLCDFARRLTDILPEKSTCSRFGGDEFVILLPEIGQCTELSAEVVANLALQILEQVSIPFNVNNHTLYCSTSIGIAMFPDASNQAVDILRHADTALYRVKAMGRNGFQFFDPEMQSSAQERLEVEKGLHLALENEEFELYYQPQVDDTSDIIGAEALLRWNHPDKGMLAPGEFIAIAEESGQIVEISDWVLSAALHQLAQWKETGLPATFRRLAINISPTQFMQVDFVERFFALMEKVQLPGEMIELEITENMLLNNFAVASNKMKLLKQRGISFAIDDFGTGYSSLKYLRYLPLDILKIDRSFVTNLRASSEEAAIVEVIIATADRLDLQVIAEGVEKAEELSALKTLGCGCFQGYLFSRPVPAEQLFRQEDKEPVVT